MEMFTAIFTQLGVDSSLVPQLVIIVVAFILAKVLFLGKLQSVLETREEKTVKLENSADETIEKVNRMQTEYKNKINEANRSTLKSTTDKKQKLTEKYTAQFKEVEKEVGQHVDQSCNNFGKELANSKVEYLAEADSLAQSLIKKILQ